MMRGGDGWRIPRDGNPVAAGGVSGPSLRPVRGHPR